MAKKDGLLRRAKRYAKGLENQMKRKENGTFMLYLVLRLLVVLVAVLGFLQGRYEYVFICVLSLVLFLVPSFLERKLQMQLPSSLEKIILLFIYAAEIMGELQAFYTRIPWWDTMLHTLNGFLCAAIGFALVDVLNTNRRVRVQLAPIYLAVVAFCFSMTVGVLWEFFEFGMDVLFGFDMQKDTVLSSISSVLLDPTGGQRPVAIENITEMSLNGQPLGVGGYLDIGLYDTMKDMLVNLIGAVAFSIVGYFHVKSRGENSFAKAFIPVPVPKDNSNVTPEGNERPSAKPMHGQDIKPNDNPTAPTDAP